MATRSTIAKYNADGSITAIYCHYDGYPEHNGKMLQTHYATPAAVDALLSLGSFSGLYETEGKTADSLYDEPAVTLNSVDSWVNHYVNSWCEYGYLWDGNEWLCFDFDNGQVMSDDRTLYYDEVVRSLSDKHNPALRLQLL